MGIKFEAKRLYKMGQRYAKHQMQTGVRVYHQRHYQQAIGRWRAALNKLKYSTFLNILSKSFFFV